MRRLAIAFHAALLISAIFAGGQVLAQGLEPPPPPPPIEIPGLKPAASLPLSEKDVALLAQLETTVDGMIAEIEARRTDMLETAGGPLATLLLASLYQEAGAAPVGAGLDTTMPALPPTDPSVPPPDLTTPGVEWQAGDTERVWAMAADFAHFYDRYLTELKAYRAALPGRPAAVIQQFGTTQQALAGADGRVSLTTEMRGALSAELEHLENAHKVWKLVERRLVAAYVPRRQDVVMLLLARRASAYQSAADLERRWEAAWRYAHGQWPDASYDEQQRIKDALSDTYNQLEGPYTRQFECGLLLDTAALAQADTVKPTRVPPTMIYRNPALFVTHIQGKTYLPPLDIDGYFAAMTEAPADLPDCAVTEVPVDPVPSADASAPPPKPCQDCDDRKIELQAVEMTLLPMLREESLLKQRLKDGPTAKELLDRYIALTSEAEQVETNTEVGVRLEADPLASRKSTLAFWIEAIRQSIPDERSQHVMWVLAQEDPFTYMFAQMGVEWAQKIVNKKMHYIAIPSAEHRFGASDPWNRERSTELEDKEARLAQAVRDLLENDALFADLNQRIQHARLAWEERQSLEYRLEHLKEEIAGLEKERRALKAALEDCLRQCRGQ